MHWQSPAKQWKGADRIPCDRNAVRGSPRISLVGGCSGVYSHAADGPIQASSLPSAPTVDSSPPPEAEPRLRSAVPSSSPSITVRALLGLLVLASLLTLPTTASARTLIDGGTTTTTSAATAPVGRAVALDPIEPSRSAFDFGDVPIGLTPRQTVTLTNTTGRTIGVTGVSMDVNDYNVYGDFGLISPGRSRDFEIEFAPQRLGEESGTISFSTWAGDVDVAVRGNGIRSLGLSLTPSVVDLGDVLPNSTTSLPVTLKNTGPLPLEINYIEAFADFFMSSNAPDAFTLAPDQERTITFRISPGGLGPGGGDIVIGDSNFGFTSQLNVSLNATNVKLAASPSPVSIASTRVTQSRTATVTITNQGTQPTELGAPTIVAASGVQGAADFSATLASTSLNPGQSTQATVRFSPTATGERGAKLRVPSSGGASPLEVNLTGTGAPAPALPMTASSLSTGGAVPTDVETGDFNADGRPDLAIGIGADGRVLTALATGGGAFSAPGTPVAATSAQPDMGLAAGDVTGDGVDDLVVANGTGVKLYRSNGTGALLLFSTLSTTPSADAKLADFDGDRLLDLVVLNRTDKQLLFFRGTGSGLAAVSGSVPMAAAPRELAIADTNADGTPDILVPTFDAGFQRVQVIRSVATAPLGSIPVFSSFTFNTTLPTPNSAGALAVGHMNADGLVDFTTGAYGYTGGLGLAQYQPDAFTSLSTPTATPGDSMLLADLDGDGQDDLASVSRTGSAVTLQRGASGGVFGEAESIDVSTQVGTLPAKMVRADLNGDGRPDLVAVKGGARVEILLNASSAPVPAGPGRALIQEFRPGSAPYLTVHNPSRSQRLRLGGWQVRFPGGAQFTFPAEAQLPPRASLQLRAAGFTAAGTPNAQFVGTLFGYFAIPSGVEGAALVGPTGATVDAVGLSSAPAAFREGDGLAARTFGAAGGFQRLDRAGGSVDTNVNADDFAALDPQATDGSGTVLGLPNWRRSYEATNRNDFLQSSLVDPSVAASQAPNRERIGDTLWIRRTITNCSGGIAIGVCVNADKSVGGVAVRRLFLRITELSTIGNSAGAILTSVGATRPSTGGAYPADARTTEMNALGGDRGTGIGTTFNLNDALPGNGLLPGQSITVAFQFRVLRGGPFTFGYAIDDDVEPAAADAPTQTPTVGTPEPANGASTTDEDAPIVIPPASAAAPEVVAGKVAAPTNPVAAQAALTTSKPATKAKAKCLTKAQYKRLKPKQRKRAKLCAPKRTTSSAAKTTKKGAR